MVLKSVLEVSSHMQSFSYVKKGQEKVKTPATFFPTEHSLMGPGNVNLERQGNVNQKEPAFYPKRHLFTLFLRAGGVPPPQMF